MKHFNVKILMTALLATYFGLSAGADEYKVSEAARWSFGGWSETLTTVTSHTGNNGLYLRAGTSEKKINVNDSGTKMVKYTDEASFSTTGYVILSMCPEGSLNYGTAGDAFSVKPSLAINIDKPGRIHIFLAVRKGGETGGKAIGEAYSVKAVLDEEVIKEIKGTVTADNQDMEIVVHAHKAGTLFLHGTQRLTIYHAKFIPNTMGYITATSFWPMSQFTDGNLIPSEGGDGTKGSVMNMDGLYIHTRDNQSVSVAADNRGFLFGETGYSIAKPQKRLSMSTGGSVNSKFAYEKVVINAIAADVAPGTVYFGVRSANYNDRQFELYYNGTKVKTKNYDGTKNMTIDTTTVGSGSYYFKASNGSWNFVGLLFIPTTPITMTRKVTLNDKGYATFSASQNYTLPSDLKAYVVSELDLENGNIKTKSTNIIPAATGVILCGEPGQHILTSTETKGVVGTNYLVANLTDYNLQSESSTTVGDVTSYYYNFILVPDGDGVKFDKSNGDGKLGANKAFLQINKNVIDDLGARSLTISFDDSETTGIANANVNLNANVKKSYYNLAGQRVAQPTKGLYIVNGKKYIVK